MSPPMSKTSKPKRIQKAQTPKSRKVKEEVKK